MKKAIAFNTATQESRTVTAQQYASLIAADPAVAGVMQLTSPQKKVPLIFHRAHMKQGFEVHVKPYFARAAGHGLPGHVLDTKGVTFQQALAAGHKILLSLNDDLSYRMLNFREMTGQSCQPLEAWMSRHHGSYVSVSIHSAAEAVKKIRAIHEAIPKNTMNDRVHVLYRGGVIGYRDFFMGERAPDFRRLYDDLKAAHMGVRQEEARVVGFPRLFRFVPTKSTVDEKGARGLKGNLVPSEGGAVRLFSKLVFSKHAKDDEAGCASIKQALCEGKAFNVLASPTVSVDPEEDTEEKGWHMLRWVINNPAHQLAPVSAPSATPRPAP